jgi:hypothetical protein
MHYTPHVDYAFSRVVHIIRDVNYGWLLRTIHANGASFFFICLYLHVGRGLYYGSSSSSSYRGSFYRVCSPLGANIFLRSYCYYQSSFSGSLCWGYGRAMSMGRVRSRQRDSKSVFYFSLPHSFHYCRSCYNPLSFSPPNRV